MPVVIQLIYSFLIQVFLLYIVAIVCNLLWCVAGLLQDLFHELGRAKGVSWTTNIHFLHSSIYCTVRSIHTFGIKYQLTLHKMVHLAYDLVLSVLLLKLDQKLSSCVAVSVGAEPVTVHVRMLLSLSMLLFQADLVYHSVERPDPNGEACQDTQTSIG
jgi:hypothetical protein